MIYVTCRLTAKNRDQLRDPTVGNRVWASFTFTFSTSDHARTHDTALTASSTFAFNRLYLFSFVCYFIEFTLYVSMFSSYLVLAIAFWNWLLNWYVNLCYCLELDLYMGWQWCNLFRICQLVFSAILWVKLLEMLLLCCHIRFVGIGQWSRGHFLKLTG